MINSRNDEGDSLSANFVAQVRGELIINHQSFLNSQLLRSACLPNCWNEASPTVGAVIDRAYSCLF